MSELQYSSSPRCTWLWAPDTETAARVRTTAGGDIATHGDDELPLITDVGIAGDELQACEALARTGFTFTWHPSEHRVARQPPIWQIMAYYWMTSLDEVEEHDDCAGEAEHVFVWESSDGDSIDHEIAGLTEAVGLGGFDGQTRQWRLNRGGGQGAHRDGEGGVELVVLQRDHGAWLAL